MTARLTTGVAQATPSASVATPSQAAATEMHVALLCSALECSFVIFAGSTTLRSKTELQSFHLKVHICAEECEWDPKWKCDHNDVTRAAAAQSHGARRP